MPSGLFDRWKTKSDNMDVLYVPNSQNGQYVMPFLQIATIPQVS
jgi:hypothetical protein